MRQSIVAVTVREAAERLGAHRVTIYKQLSKKQLAAIKEGENWKIFLLLIEPDDSEPFYVRVPYNMLSTVLGEYKHMFKEE